MCLCPVNKNAQIVRKRHNHQDTPFDMVHLTISLETSVIIRFARVGQNCEVPAATHLFRPELRSACGNALGAPLYFFTEHLWGAHCV